MSILSAVATPDPLLTALHNYGERLVKEGDDAVPSYALSGVLYLSPSGWLLLSIPNALVRGAFQALSAPGAELPPSGLSGKLEAHISVMNQQEVVAVGADRINERGKTFQFNIGRVVEFAPDGWSGVEKCFAFRVHSPELQALRRSYGLSSLPHGGDRPFHVTLAIVRSGVLGRNSTAKGDV